MMRKDQSGVITLEACISVLMFLLLMLLLSGLFLMFMAQTVTAHVVLETTESMSLEAYSLEKLAVDEGTIGGVGDQLGKLVSSWFGNAEKSPNFVSAKKWYDGDDKEIAAAIKERFVGYLSGGDEAKADKLLTMMNVVNGLDGLDFSQSYVEDDTLHVFLAYKLKYNFNIGPLKDVPVEQTACSKLWK